MCTEQDKAQVQVEELEGEPKAVKKGFGSEVRANDFRLLKLTLVMVILALISAIIHGQI
jgi:hypothetical protein